MDKIYQIIIILIGIFIFCKVLNNVNTPIIKKINKYNPFATSMIFTYMEEPTNFNNEKKIQLLSKNNDVPIFFKLCIKLMKRQFNNLVVLTPNNYREYAKIFQLKCLQNQNTH